jgi:hypothetical protein
MEGGRSRLCRVPDRLRDSSLLSEAQEFANKHTRFTVWSRLLAFTKLGFYSKRPHRAGVSSLGELTPAFLL